MPSQRTLFDLDGRVVLVTGGSRGLGLQIAEALGDYGASVMISARKHAELDAALAQLRQRDIRAEAFAADIARPESIHAQYSSMCASNTSRSLPEDCLTWPIYADKARCVAGGTSKLGANCSAQSPDAFISASDRIFRPAPRA